MKKKKKKNSSACNSKNCTYVCLRDKYQKQFMDTFHFTTQNIKTWFVI